MFSLAMAALLLKTQALWLLANFTNAKYMDSAVPGTRVRARSDTSKLGQRKRTIGPSGYRLKIRNK